MLRKFIAAATMALVLTGLATFARADDSPVEDDGIPDPSIATSLPPAIGGLGGARAALAKAGFQFGVNYIADAFGNTSGGVRRGASYTGRTEFVVDGDLQKAFGLSGLTFHANVFQIHGRGLSRRNLFNVSLVSNIEAARSTRLSEFWFEQDILADKLTVRLGQFGADDEFFTSSYAGLFINATFGWPAITALNLPSGGPAYPLTAPGARIKITPIKDVSFVAAVFNGDPAGRRGVLQDPDPQLRNNDGVRFRLRDPPFVIAEGQYTYEFGGLTGTANFGGWHHFGRFADQRFGTDFLPLAAMQSNGFAQSRRGDRGVYAVLDQQLYAVKEGDAGKGLGAFVRISLSPADRNPASFYLDGGLNFTGVIPGRPDDAFGIAASYTKFSSRIAGFDRDSAILSGMPTPVRSAEAAIEATYLANVIDGVGIQPNFQYIIRPGGGIVDPRDPAGLRRIHNAAVFGIRSTIRY